jgi:hypothetical protein
MMARIDDQIAALMALPDAALSEEWRKVYKSLPRRIPADLLRRGIAYRLQKRAYGGCRRRSHACWRPAEGRRQKSNQTSGWCGSGTVAPSM